VRKPCGNLSLSIGVATEPEVADTEGGTATSARVMLQFRRSGIVFKANCILGKNLDEMDFKLGAERSLFVNGRLDVSIEHEICCCTSSL
jgi:hypothetical protein